MSDQGRYEDDFEISADESPTNRKHVPMPLLKSSDASPTPPAARDAARGKGLSRPEPPCVNGNKSLPSTTTSGGSRLPQLIHPPTLRSAHKKAPVAPTNAHLLHASKMTSVMQMGPDKEHGQRAVDSSVDDVDKNEVSFSAVHDPFNATPSASELRPEVVYSSSPSVKTRSSSPLGTRTSSSGSPLKPDARRQCGAAAPSRERLRTLPSRTEKGADGNKASHGQPPRHQKPGSVFSSKIRPFHGKVDVWKRHEGGSVKKPLDGSQASSSWATQQSLQAPSAAQTDQNDGTDETPVVNSKEVLWRHPKNISGSTRDRSPEGDQQSSSGDSSSETEGTPRAARRKKGKKATAKAKDEGSDAQDQQSSSGDSSSETEGTPRAARRKKGKKATAKTKDEGAGAQDQQSSSDESPPRRKGAPRAARRKRVKKAMARARGEGPSARGRRSESGESPPRNGGESCAARLEQVRREIEKTKEEIAGVRCVRRELEMSLHPSTRSNAKGRSQRAHVDVDRLERENEHFRRLLELRERWNGAFDLPLRIAEEELKYALDELQRAKRRRREVWTENRRLSIALTQIVKDHKPAHEKVANQYRDGMYSRRTIQSKVELMHEKLAAARETSAYLSNQICRLEEHIRAEGLTSMKPEDYTAMQQAVERNTKTIQKLTASVAAPLGTAGSSSHGDMQSSTGSLPSVRYPGRSQMESLLAKLLRQLERKEDQKKALLQRLGETEPTAAKGKEDAVKPSPREHAPTQENKESKELKRVPSKHGRSDGSLALSLTDGAAASHSVSPSMKGGSHGEQQQQSKKGSDWVNGVIAPRDADGTRVMEAKRSKPSLTNLDETVLGKSEGRENGHSPSPAVISSANSNHSSELAYKAVLDGLKRRLVLGDELPVDMKSPSHYSELDEARCPIDGQQSSLSPRTLTKPGSTATGYTALSKESSMGGKNGVDSAVAQEAAENGRTTPLWLREY